MNETISLIPLNNSVQLILPLLIVIGTALLVFVVDLFTTRKAVLAWLAATGLLCGAAASIGHWVKIDGGIDLVTHATETGFNNSIALDKYSAFATVLVIAIALLTVLLSDAYMTARRVPLGEYYGLLLLVVSGMIAMAMATDVITFFVAFELMSLPSYVLAGFLRRDRRAGEAGLKYFVNGAFASAILLFGLALLVGYTGQTNYTGMGIAMVAQSRLDGALMLAVLFILTGFAFKISAVPFHGWAPDVYEGAPTPVTAFMSVAVKAGAFMGFMRLFSTFALPTLLPGVTTTEWHVNAGQVALWTNALVLLAIPTMVLGNVLALPQRNLKRMLAYSSIAHAGYILLGLIATGRSQDAAGMRAVLFYLGVYALMNVGAFGVLIRIRSRRTYDYTLDGISGLGRTMPWTGLAFTLFLASLAGIPPLAGFWGKFYVFAALINSGAWWLAVIAVAMSAISAFYYLRVVWYMFFREAEHELKAVERDCGPSAGVVTALVIAALGVIGLGLYPTPLMDFAGSALSALMQALGG